MAGRIDLNSGNTFNESSDTLTAAKLNKMLTQGYGTLANPPWPVNEGGTGHTTASSRGVGLISDGSTYDLEYMRHGPEGYGLGVNAKNNTSNPNNQIDIDATTLFIRSTSSQLEGYLLTSINLTADLTVSGANGLDTGAEANSTWYYAYVIWNGTTIASLLSISTDVDSITMPSGYTHGALVGAFYNDSSGDFHTAEFCGRRAAIERRVAFTGTLTGADAYQALDLSAIIPPIAICASGVYGAQSVVDAKCVVSKDATALNEQVIVVGAAASAYQNFSACSPFTIPYDSTNEQIMHKAVNNSDTYRIEMSGYVI